MSVLPFPSQRTRRADGPGAETPAGEAPEPVPSLREALGAELRDERHAQGRTLADVARRAAVSVAYLSEVERGRKDVSSDVLTSISEALDLPVPVLLQRTARRLTGSGTFALAA